MQHAFNPRAGAGPAFRSNDYRATCVEDGTPLTLPTVEQIKLVQDSFASVESIAEAAAGRWKKMYSINPSLGLSMLALVPFS
jgi:hypothetical protein